MLGVGLTKLSLVNYLVSQLLLRADRVERLREFVPECSQSDWELTSPDSGCK